MAIHKIENEKLIVEVNDFGAELMSVQHKELGMEYLWNGDPSYWNRRSPVLFPFVGSLKGKEYRHNGKTYYMGQHGFARDMEFELVSKTHSEIWHRLVSDKETKEKYPFDFELQIGYQLDKNGIKVLWEVRNAGKDTMLFSIGAHPAFLCPIFDIERKEPVGEQTDYFIAFEEAGQLETGCIDMECGLLSDSTKSITLIPDEAGNGLLKITGDLFDHDALVLEGNQTKRISLLRPDKTPYVTVEFDAPLVGVWSKLGGAPFICIEPWYGRCDRVSFEGTLQEREYVYQLGEGEVFEAGYRMRFF